MVAEMCMKTYGLQRKKVGVFWGCLMAGVAVFSAPVYAASQDFTSNVGAGGVQGSATFTPGTDSITLVLTALNGNPPSIAQLLTDISFSVSGGGGVTGDTTPTPTGQLTHCTSGSTCADVAGTANPWSFGVNTGFGNGPIGTGNYLLTTLVGSDKTPIIGPTTASYNSPDGIGSTNFNTFLKGTGTFTLGILGVTSDSIISDVTFSFGTAPETLVGVPIPAAVWLFVSGLVGLVGIARRRQSGIATGPSMSAA